MLPQEKGVLLRAIRMMVDRPTEITEETMNLLSSEGVATLLTNSRCDGR